MVAEKRRRWVVVVVRELTRPASIWEAEEERRFALVVGVDRGDHQRNYAKAEQAAWRTL